MGNRPHISIPSRSIAGPTQLCSCVCVCVCVCVWCVFRGFADRLGVLSVLGIPHISLLLGSFTLSLPHRHGFSSLRNPLSQRCRPSLEPGEVQMNGDLVLRGPSWPEISAS